MLWKRTAAGTALPRHNIPLAFASAAAALVVGVVATAAALRVEQKDWQWVVHTREVLERLESMRSNLVEARAMQRTFLLVHSPSSMQEFEVSAAKALDDVTVLRRLTIDNPTQQATLVPLEAQATGLLAELRDVAATHPVPGPAVIAGDLQRFDKVRSLLATLRAEEEALLAERTRDADRARVVTLLAVGTLGVLSLLLMAYLRRVVARDTAFIGESEERFRTLADNMSQLAWVAEPGGDIAWYNKRWYDFTGASPEAMRGWGWTQVHHPEHLDRVVSRIKHSFETGEPWEDTFPLRGRDGEYRWFLSRAVPIRDERGRIERWFGTNTDITPQREAEAALADLNRSLEERVQSRTRALEDANAEMEAFTYSVSHDLRAPLRGIHGYAQALQEDYGASLAEEGRTYLQRIASAAARMEDLIQDLLAYSRLSREELQASPVDLDALSDAALQALKVPIAESGAEVVVDHPIPGVMGTRAVLLQVMQNLVSNAIKFVAKDTPPRVRVSGERRGAMVHVSIEDNGIGIEPRHRDRIFRVFERLHGADIYPGTGIGLAIVRKGIERMNGRTGVESSPSGGSRFWFELPAAPEAA